VIAWLLTVTFICAVVAVVLGVYASSRPPTALDRSAAALRGHGVRAALFFTRLGRWRALVLISAVTLGVAFTLHSAVEALVILFAVQTLGQATSARLKVLYRRRRPDAFIRRVETDRSYPSGHATTAVVFFLGLAMIVAQSPLPRWLALLLTAALGVCVIGIPWSRLALGAHYATDVVGGLFLGAAWLCVAVAIIARFAPTSVR
jgi:undecaprenyl-diphosphatase